MPDLFANERFQPGIVATKGFVITPNDSADLPFFPNCIRITGSSGNIAVVWPDGSETTEPVSTGDVWNWRITRIKATGTTATGIRGYL